MEKEIPFVAYSNDELDGKDPVGTHAICNNCGGEHEVRYGEELIEDGTWKPSKVLAFITCPENDATYLVGIKGSLLNAPKADTPKEDNPMKSYKIVIEVTDAGGTYTAGSIEEANEIAEAESNDIYNRLGGRCSVDIVSVEEVKND